MLLLELLDPAPLISGDLGGDWDIRRYEEMSEGYDEAFTSFAGIHMTHDAALISSKRDLLDHMPIRQNGGNGARLQLLQQNWREANFEWKLGFEQGEKTLGLIQIVKHLLCVPPCQPSAA